MIFVLYNRSTFPAMIVWASAAVSLDGYIDDTTSRRLVPVSYTHLDVYKRQIPSCYERTLHNHFHKNFGINLFLEKYQEYLTKTGKDADNKGRFEKFLIDLGIRDKYFALKEEDKEIVKNFLAALGNLDQTSVSAVSYTHLPECRATGRAPAVADQTQA